MYSISLVEGSSSLVLQGTGMASPLKGSQLSPEIEVLADELARETIDLVLEGSESSIQTFIEGLGRYLARGAAAVIEPVHEPVYLVKQLDSSSASAWRSEVIGGGITRLGYGAADQELGTAGIRVRIERRDYWEGAEAELSVTNVNGTNKNVYNHHDGVGTVPYKHVNYFDVTGITGDLPAPARIEIKNNYTSTKKISTLWLGQNIWSDPANLVYTLEGEAGVSGTSTASATCSGGYYALLTWAATTETKLTEWVINAATLQSAKGNLFRPLLRLVEAHNLAGLTFRIKIVFEEGVNPYTQYLLADSGTTKAANVMLEELPVIQLPPYLVGLGQASLKLCLYVTCSTAGTKTLKVDFLQLFALDGYRKYAALVDGLAEQQYLIDDGMSGYLYSQFKESSEYRNGGWMGYGPGVLLEPGKTNRFMLLVGQDMVVDRCCIVHVYYRPRRVVL